MGFHQRETISRERALPGDRSGSGPGIAFQHVLREAEGQMEPRHAAILAGHKAVPGLLAILSCTPSHNRIADSAQGEEPGQDLSRRQT